MTGCLGFRIMLSFGSLGETSFSFVAKNGVLAIGQGRDCQ